MHRGGSGIRRIGVAVGVIFASLALVACDSDDHQTAMSTPRVESSVETGTPDAVAGLDGLRAISDDAASIAASVINGDVEALTRRAEMTEVPCTQEIGLGGGPPCTGDDAPGTVYSMFPTAGCEGTWTSDVNALFSNVVKEAGPLYALAALDGPSTEHWPRGDYVLIFEPREGAVPIQAVALFISDGRIVRTQLGCSTAKGLIENTRPTPTVEWRAAGQ